MLRDMPVLESKLAFDPPVTVNPVLGGGGFEPLPIGPKSPTAELAMAFMLGALSPSMTGGV